MELLKSLIEVPGASSDELKIKEFILNYVKINAQNWKSVPQIFEGEEFQDTFVLVFGNPKTAIYAHIDTIGFSVGYNNELIKIGGPKIIDGTVLVGEDSQGTIETELMVIEGEDDTNTIKCVFDREIDRGTILTYKPNFRMDKEFVQSPYLDNRLGVYAALKVAETLENGAIAFTSYEEHGGNSVTNIANFLYEKYNVKQALISDITWVTNGVVHGGGVAISLRDSLLPRKSYLNSILNIAKNSNVKYQLEVESAGGSDGGMIQKSHLPIDWCFIGAAEDNVHTPDEKVNLKDIESMIDLYKVLMEKL